MGVAEQMLLNQVTIFNPSNSSTLPTYTHTNTHRNTDTPINLVDGPITGPSNYAFGWSNPWEIYNGKD